MQPEIGNSCFYLGTTKKILEVAAQIYSVLRNMAQMYELKKMNS